MKFVNFIAMLCAAFVLSAAETAIWDGTQASVKTGNKATTATAADGVLTLSGKSSDTARYSYQDCRIAVAPTAVKGKKLSVTIEPATTFSGDTIYFKGLNAQGKEVFSYVAYAVPAKKATYVIDFGKTTSPFRWLDAQIKMGPETPVSFLQFFYGRATKESDMKVTISDIKLVD